MQHELNPVDVKALEEYVCSVEQAIAMGAISHLTSPVELGSLRLTLHEVGDILDQRLADSGRCLGSTPVDQTVEVA